jgi:lipid A 3-O-deacylase
VINRIAGILIGVIIGIGLVSGELSAGPTTYDMSTLLFQKHPFSTVSPLDPAVSGPLPPTLIRAPARVPQPTIVPRAGSRIAAQKNQQERRPPITPQVGADTATASSRGIGVSDIFSEIRLGGLVHDQGPFSRNEEDGFDANIEVLFVSPKFLEIVWSPRPHIGGNINSEGDTSQAYIGLTWEWSFWGGWFAGFSLGGAIHDGKLTTLRIDRKELGCRILFRESVEGGYRFGGRHSISGFLDHISNANICDNNEGLENYGIRYGYRF